MGLLSAIGIAGMYRALRANVITKSGKAVETAGDLDTLLLDKTGTITIGNRKATNFWADGIQSEKNLLKPAYWHHLQMKHRKENQLLNLQNQKAFAKTRY